MKKSSKSLFNQLINLIDWQEFNRIISDSQSDYYYKKFKTREHFLTLLYAVLKGYDSLREIILGMNAEAIKFKNIGFQRIPARSTLADANKNRSPEFFAKIYFHFYEKYKSLLSDSTNKDWEKYLKIIDSTTFTIFSNVLKGAGRNPKHGKKKGGMKAHCVIKWIEQVPYFIHYTSAATHDSVVLRNVQFSPKDILAMDRAYIDYELFEEYSKNDIIYVTKLKKNLKYEILESIFVIDENGKAVNRIMKVRFRNDKVSHIARLVTYWRKGRHCQSATLITNDFNMDFKEIIEIYDHRWAIETMFKQLKQNFQIRYFYGDSANAIKIQVWVTMIANLLMMVVKKLVKKREKKDLCFSNMVSVVRQMLMYYIDLYKLLAYPEYVWDSQLEEIFDPQLKIDFVIANSS